jgi:hypothetical protein
MTDMSSDATESVIPDAAVWSLAETSAQGESVSSSVEVVFRRQPKPVDARHRIAYRTALLVLVLSHFNRRAAKLTNLHTVMWATRSSRTRQMFKAWWSGRRTYNTTTDRLDPDLQVTLNLALIDGVIAPAGGGTRTRLTDKGTELARLIDDQPEVLTVEKTFLAGLTRLSDAEMERRLGETPR